MAMLDDILDRWDKDCKFETDNLATSSLRTANLHATYLRLLVNSKLKLTSLNIEYNTLRKIKFRYYRGELNRAELLELGWEPWQFVKPLKNEMSEFLLGDQDLNKITTRIEYINTVLFALESILSQIKQRDWQIRNAIEYNKFMAGN